MFAKVIKEKLKEKNLSIRALCRKVKLDASFLSKVLNGERNPPSDEKIIYKIAEVLDIDPIKLVFYTGRIPEKLQSMFYNDEFIDNLLNSTKKQSERKQIKKFIYKKPIITEISEELL